MVNKLFAQCMLSLLIFILVASCGESIKNTNTEADNVTFFEDIIVGDSLEECLANGSIQYYGKPNAYLDYEWELKDSYVKSYFSKTGVSFDENQIVNEVFLSCTNAKGQGRNTKDEIDESLRFIMKYFSERYAGMKKSSIKSKVGCLYDEGQQFVWETPYLLIKVKNYKCLHDEVVCNSIHERLLAGPCPNEIFNGGDYVDVYITRK